MTKSDEVFLRMLPAMAAKCLVVYFKLAHASADLAPPGIPDQDLKP